MPDGDENLNVSITGTATDGNGVSTAGTPLLITVTWD
jgi:hypothetical protein